MLYGKKKGKNMSYNCETFKVKKLENLMIPVKYLLHPEREDWAFEKEENYTDTNEIESITFTNMDSKITGRLEIFNNDLLIVENIDISGEGSGTIMNEILEPALKNSKGELIVSCVWEGGDSINQLIVKDGNITWKDIDV